MINIIKNINTKVNKYKCQATEVPPMLLFQNEKEYLQPLPPTSVIESYLNLDLGATVHDDLQLPNIKVSLYTYIDLVNSNEKDVVYALCELTELEISAKRERAIHACVRVANFPFIKTVDDFDFSFQPSINKQEILDLATLRFIENNGNILFVGTSGVGKTHLATSIGIECARKRYSTYFISFHELI